MKKFTFTLSIILLLVGHCWALTYYVDYETGVDTNDGLTKSTPWKHVKGDPAATDRAAAHTWAAGDTYIFKRGVVYTLSTGGGIDIRTMAGTNIAPITYTSDDSWGTGSKGILDGGGQTIPFLLRVVGISTGNVLISNLEGRNVEGVCFEVSGGTDIVLSNLVGHSNAVTATVAYGIYVHGALAGSIYVNNCETYNNKNYGTVAGNSSTGVIIFNKCISHHNGTNDGFRSDNDNSVMIWNDCISYNNAQDGWDLFNSNNKTINRCVAYGNVAAGFKLGAGLTTKGTVINYSLAYNNTGSGFRANTGNGYTLTNNTAYGNSYQQFEFESCDSSCTLYNNIGSGSGEALRVRSINGPVMNYNIWHNATGGAITTAIETSSIAVMVTGGTKPIAGATMTGVTSGKSAILLTTPAIWAGTITLYFRTKSGIFQSENVTFTGGGLGTIPGDLTTTAGGSFKGKDLGGWQTITRQDANSQFVDPLFVNATASDYRLKSGSPAIKAGVYVPGVHDLAGARDIAGQSVLNNPRPDIGAYKHIDVTSPPPQNLRMR